jgi:hypothetical protein
MFDNRGSKRETRRNQMRKTLYKGLSLCCIAMLFGAGWAMEGDDCASPIVVPQLPYFKIIENSAEYSSFMDLGDGNSCTGNPTAACDVFFEVTTPPCGQCFELEVVMPCGGEDADFCTYVLESNCDPNSCIAGADDYGPGENEYLEIELEGSQTYYFVIDGKTVDDVGCVMINLSECEVDVEEGARSVFIGPGLSIMPNPAQSETQISFSLRHPSHVTVDVLSCSGQRIRTLFSGDTQEGTHSVVWNGETDAGARLPSGTYFVILATETEKVMRRVQLME